MSSNAYFWTLSALLQGFAALIALSGAFAVFRLRFNSDQAASKMREIHSLVLFSDMLRGKLMVVNQIPQTYINCLEEYRRDLKQQMEARGATEPMRKNWGRERDQAQRYIKEFQNNIRDRDQIKLWTRLSVLFCGIVVLTTMVLLPFGDFFCPAILRLVTSISLLLAAVALAITVLAIITMLAERTLGT